ncbi:DNA adenine methylase [Clostridium sp. HBUAS56010]|uniref:DNA adenine methylase n=1 Tax=Clostridium sp. HBUAS56010 TaxID=2571127 RepID=UPI001178A1F9|nr:DNA adenine methylase [Clostridium sp. HBUAS56010]
MRFIGSKTLLLDQIKQVVDDKAPEAKSFCDIFSGTAAVARYFKQWYQVCSNDLLYFSYVLQRATVENDSMPEFPLLLEKLGIEDPVEYLGGREKKDLEELPKERRFFQNTYAPEGGRMYLNDENALRIDFARCSVEDWKAAGLLNDDEYYYLVACIVEGIPFVSNTSGTYGAFHKTWERRSYKRYQLYRLPVTHNGKDNRCFNLNGADMLKQVEGDILYIDPPYNARQYLSNYHVLETAARYDYPQVRGVTGQRMGESQRSEFCMKGKVVGAFAQLLENARFSHIILSYSTDGLMTVEEIEETMKAYGKPETFQIYEIPYRRYKSRQVKETERLKELLFYIEKQVPPCM